MDRLYRDDVFASALALFERHPNTDPLQVSWEAVHRWVVKLPEYADDPEFGQSRWLRDIQKEWYEEVSS